MEESELDFISDRTWVPLRVHLADKHQLEAPEEMTYEELNALHRRLHEDEEKPENTLV